MSEKLNMKLAITVPVTCIMCCAPLRHLYLVFGLASIWTSYCGAEEMGEVYRSVGILAVNSQIPLQEAQHDIIFLHNPAYVGIP